MDGSTLYRIANWDSLYEVAQSRKIKGPLPWISLRTKHDGDGYTELLEHPDGPSHYAAWIALLQVAAKCEPRGSLLRDNSQPATSTVLARQTRIPAEVFEAAVPRLLAIGWLIAEPVAATAVTPTLPPPSRPATSTLPPDSHHAPDTRHNKTVQDKTEEKKARARFTPPTLEEVTAYCQERAAAGKPRVDPVDWHNHYTANGWMVGKVKMKDWRAAVRTWETNKFGKGGQGGHNRPSGRHHQETVGQRPVEEV
jgi:hypothetical protein